MDEAGFQPMKGVENEKRDQGYAAGDNVTLERDRKPDWGSREEGGRRRQAFLARLIGIAKDRARADKGNADRDCFNQPRRISPEVIAGEPGGGIGDQELPQPNEKESRDTDQHVGAKAGPFARRFPFPTEQAAEDHGHESLKQDLEFLGILRGHSREYATPGVDEAIFPTAHGEEAEKRIIVGQAVANRPGAIVCLAVCPYFHTSCEARK